MIAHFFLLVELAIVPLYSLSSENIQNSNILPYKTAIFHKNKSFVMGGYTGGRLGNQFFQMAAALSVAIDHKVNAVFPEYLDWKEYGIPENLHWIFFRLNYSQPSDKIVFHYNEDPDFRYAPIPYVPNMKIRGFFQSEKYFKKNKDKILPLFEPRDTLKAYLENKYKDLLAHPNTVGIHLRAYSLEDPSTLKCFVPVGFDYFQKASEHFNDDAYFVIFSDNIEWAKKIMKNFKRPHIFIEGEEYYYDFYLLSYMKHQIVSNSSFSWWAAYLNANPAKTVIAPFPWFQPNWHNAPGNEHIIPEGWITIKP